MIVCYHRHHKGEKFHLICKALHQFLYYQKVWRKTFQIYLKINQIHFKVKYHLIIGMKEQILLNKINHKIEIKTYKISKHHLNLHLYIYQPVDNLEILINSIT